MFSIRDAVILDLAHCKRERYLFGLSCKAYTLARSAAGGFDGNDRPASSAIEAIGCQLLRCQGLPAAAIRKGSRPSAAQGGGEDSDALSQ